LLWLNRGVSHAILKVYDGFGLGVQIRLRVVETDIGAGVAGHPLRLVGTIGFRQLSDRFPPEAQTPQVLKSVG
jgi:hypothetical protein